MIVHAFICGDNVFLPRYLLVCVRRYLLVEMVYVCTHVCRMDGWNWLFSLQFKTFVLRKLLCFVLALHAIHPFVKSPIPLPPGDVREVSCIWSLASLHRATFY